MRTTPPPCRDVRSVVPELRAMEKTTVRLHPRRGEVAERGASKFGGDFLWPADEPWAVCETHNIPYVGVLQLRHSDVPELGYRPGTDLFQFLWCPRDHEPDDMPTHLVLWRRAADVRVPLTRIPKSQLTPEDAYHDGGQYLPAACVLHPERVVEFPHFDELTPEVQQRLCDWDIAGEEDLREVVEESGSFAPGEWLYRWELSVAPGTKVGGYVAWIQWPRTPSCSCGRPMEHLLTVATLEPFADRRRWCPVEDHAQSASASGSEEILDMSRVAGLELGDGGNFSLFICRQCEDWHTAAELQSG